MTPTSNSTCSGMPLLALALFAASVAGQTTYTVPGSFSSIQAAIDASLDGDTILVAPGTYLEALDLHAKSITLEGIAGADVTVIDAHSVGTTPLADTTFPGGASLVRGLTFTGGTESGVSIGFGSPSFEDCIVSGNTSSGNGGGVFVASPASATFRGCTITANASDDFALGGGVYGPATLEDCTIAFNTGGLGGGAHSITAAVDCLFEGNHAFSRGGGAWASPDTFTRCSFLDNLANGDGGGLAYFQVLGDEFVPIRDLAFVDNHAGGKGGAIFREIIGRTGFFDIHQVLERTVFQDNSSAGGLDAIDGIGGFVNPFATNPFEVTQCTFSGDTLTADGFTTLTVNSSIFYNQPGPIVGGSSVTVSYSMVQGGWPGIGNTATNPKFVDTANHDLHLQPGSVCINSGDPGLPLDADGSRADMGALPYAPWHDLDGSALSGGSSPIAHANGPLEGGTSTVLGFDAALPTSTAFLVLGFSELSAPFKQGLLVPFPDLVLDVAVPGSGSLELVFSWPTGVPSGVSLWVQWWFTDASGPAGFASSQGIVGTTP